MRRSTIYVVLAGCLVGLIGSEKKPRASEQIDAYRAEIEDWQLRREETISSPDGWMSLLGLFWLDEGAQTIGAGTDNAIALPEGRFPEHLGTFHVDGVRLSFVAGPGADVTHDGERVTELDLAVDTSEDGPTVLEHGSLSIYPIERAGRVLLRVKDSEHPALTTFEGIDNYPVDPKWRIDARFEVHEPIKTIPIANIVGLTSNSPSWGAVVFEMDGATHRIEALADPGDERLFLIFGDRTNGTETYGAGRYLYVDAPDADGRIDLDFNRAYNPPCAFTQYATCPLPPPQNRLGLRITAGEKNYKLH